jgi:hypothetical protein
MLVRKDPKTGYWNIEGLDSDQLFDIVDALIVSLSGCLRGSRRRKTHEDLIEATMRREDILKREV